jgi:hypothetical protein
MRKTLLAVTLAALPLLLDGCQTWGPTWSEVTGNRFNVTVVNRRPAIIERIDNQGAFTTNPIRIDPGVRRVVVSAPTNWTGGSDLKVFMLDAAPCKRYYLNAQFSDPMSRDFEVVIDYVETISGCQLTEPKK